MDNSSQYFGKKGGWQPWMIWAIVAFVGIVLIIGITMLIIWALGLEDRGNGNGLPT